jgi:hypothetical protein
MIDAQFKCEIFDERGALVCRDIRIFHLTKPNRPFGRYPAGYCGRWCRSLMETGELIVEWIAGDLVYYAHARCFTQTVPEAKETFLQALDLAPEIKTALIFELAG